MGQCALQSSCQEGSVMSSVAECAADFSAVPQACGVGWGWLSRILIAGTPFSMDRHYSRTAFIATTCVLEVDTYGWASHVLKGSSNDLLTYLDILHAVSVLSFIGIACCRSFLLPIFLCCRVSTSLSMCPYDGLCLARKEMKEYPVQVNGIL